jgi:hypothetical protein
MSNKNIKRIETDFELDNHEQRSAKCSVSISPSHQGKKKQSGSISKRHKANLICAICDADARGN